MVLFHHYVDRTSIVLTLVEAVLFAIALQEFAAFQVEQVGSAQVYPVHAVQKQAGVHLRTLGNPLRGIVDQRTQRGVAAA